MVTGIRLDWIVKDFFLMMSLVSTHSSRGGGACRALLNGNSGLQSCAKLGGLLGGLEQLVEDRFDLRARKFVGLGNHFAQLNQRIGQVRGRAGEREGGTLGLRR